MSYVTKDTVWPTALELDPAVKRLVDLFYSLADDMGDDAGPRMASEVFTEDAKMVSSTGEASGREAISRSRSNAWKHISSRHHTIQRVFVNDKDGCDLMLLGSIRMEFRNSKVVELQFTGRLVVRAESKAGENPRLELMQVFADSAPTLEALKGP